MRKIDTWLGGAMHGRVHVAGIDDVHADAGALELGRQHP